MRRMIQQGIAFTFALAICAGLIIGYAVELVWVEFILVSTGTLFWFLLSWYLFDHLIVEPAPAETDEEGK